MLSITVRNNYRELLENSATDAIKHQTTLF